MFEAPDKPLALSGADARARKQRHSRPYIVKAGRNVSVRLSDSFTSFARTEGDRVRGALIAAFGPDTGAEATSEALTYAWQHWDRVSAMDNTAGYLYTVGRNWARRRIKRDLRLPPPQVVHQDSDHWVEPGLPKALGRLTARQRTAVILIHGYGWTLEEAGRVLGIERSTVQKHVERGLARLRGSLGVSDAR